MPPFLNAIIDWLRAGYPDGVPESDYIPLLALLRRRLSEDEVRQIAAELAGSGDLPADKTDIQVMITKVTNEMPSEADVARVQTRLAAHAWPQDDPASFDER
ncbi:DUF3349 domain-containing protein [Nocardia brasiliensis]|uniref:DUF3349 domain-containing protein n=1 Tax=Nocardia brasiliensis TaxID=37326 RepID=UPI0018941D7E|nr:DUF3349 domain-containing protein [Nocardia brasiliensis]MBF6128244.1 DUF3349 domain-containing protein [Nocardia brasiliensis]MBF6546413.1 DUF3349 domain-containing protein [Nocardia brasiliensis]